MNSKMVINYQNLRHKKQLEQLEHLFESIS